ncbi:ABC transporter ATP-binding protein [Alicyclobacillus cycloheptanicus]|nr:ABC transporter ATP-binding protein [Alicyclobacillus cycloheptanicus]
MTSAVYCDGVTKRFGKQFALNELHLAIPKGKIVGVLGPNGAGKSTLFRMLTGLAKPDRGSISVLGQRPGWRTNAHIAYLPDRARWYGDHTVNRAFHWGESLLPGFDRAVAERLAAFMNIDLDARVSGMSRGQEARLMLILCVARSVPLIILDEPFSGIDVISRERIIESLIDHMSSSELADVERTVLISTHEIYEAEALFDHAVFLRDGQVALSGDADELRAAHGSMHATMKQLYR